MKVVVERIENAWLRGELIRLGAKERPVKDAVIIDATTGKVSIRRSFSTLLVLESGVIVYPGSPGEVCATFDGGYPPSSRITHVSQTAFCTDSR